MPVAIAGLAGLPALVLVDPKAQAFSRELIRIIVPFDVGVRQFRAAQGRRVHASRENSPNTVRLTACRAGERAADGGKGCLSLPFG
jgi:hypothetical protein